LRSFSKKHDRGFQFHDRFFKISIVSPKKRFVIGKSGLSARTLLHSLTRSVSNAVRIHFSAFCIGQALPKKWSRGTFPAFSRRGDRAVKPLETRGRGGYQGIAKRTLFD
jgi:hypothetical protein